MKTYKMTISDSHYFTINPDSRNFSCTETIVKEGKDKDGNPKLITSNDIWYPSTFKAAFYDIYQRLIKDASSDAVIEDFKTMSETFNNCLKQVVEIGIQLDIQIKS